MFEDTFSGHVLVASQNRRWFGGFQRPKSNLYGFRLYDRCPDNESESVHFTALRAPVQFFPSGLRQLRALRFVIHLQIITLEQSLADRALIKIQPTEERSDDTRAKRRHYPPRNQSSRICAVASKALYNAVPKSLLFSPSLVEVSSLRSSVPGYTGANGPQTC